MIFNSHQSKMQKIKSTFNQITSLLAVDPTVDQSEEIFRRLNVFAEIRDEDHNSAKKVHQAEEMLDQLMKGDIEEIIKSGNKSNIAEVLRGACLNYINIGGSYVYEALLMPPLLQRANNCYEKALKIMEQYKRYNFPYVNDFLCLIYHGFGKVLFSCGEIEQSNEYFRKGIALAVTLDFAVESQNAMKGAIEWQRGK